MITQPGMVLNRFIWFFSYSLSLLSPCNPTPHAPIALHPSILPESIRHWFVKGLEDSTPSPCMMPLQEFKRREPRGGLWYFSPSKEQQAKATTCTSAGA